jgi:hypothetical protein
MAQLTITEALQEIKTIGLRLTKKRNAITPYIARDSRVRDPFEVQGGSAKYIREERQSISDLETRQVAIRTAIQQANLSSSLTIGNVTKSVSEWLTWRREIAENQKSFVGLLIAHVQKVRAEVQQKGGKLVSVASAEVNMSQQNPTEVVVSVDEKDLLTEQDALENTLGVLDGKLSLFNAIAVIEI